MAPRLLPEQTPEQIAAELEAFLARHPTPLVLEDGKVLFDLRSARYTLSTEHNRCTLHLWADDRNLVRRILAAEPRPKLLRLSTQRFGHARPTLLELAAEQDRRTPGARETTRQRYLKLLERTLETHFEGWRPEAFRTAMDLEKSFGPAYARGILTQGNRAWAVIAVNDEESPATIDGILTFGILWLQHCRDHAGGRRLVQGLRLVLPAGTATLTLSRLPWLHEEAQWQLFEFHQRDALLTPRHPAAEGNLDSHLLPLPNAERARERFAAPTARVLACVPPASREEVVPHLRSATELAFLWHGLEFARIRFSAANQSFNRVEEITFGTGASETPLTPASEPALCTLVEALCQRRGPAGDPRDPLFRMAPERWLEDNVRRHLAHLDDHLDPTLVYAQVPAFAAADRGMLDLLGLSADGRLAVFELKAAEDPQLALQGLDYWIRVRWHHTHNLAEGGLGDFQRQGYFPGARLAPGDPRLYLVAPALRIHPATEIILRRLSPRVHWTLIALDERWRHRIRPVWRKRHTDPPTRAT